MMLATLIEYAYELIKIIVIGVMVERVVLAMGFAFTDCNDKEINA